MSKIDYVWSWMGRAKYWIVGAIIVLIVGFADDNSFWNRHKRKVVLRELNSEIANCKEQYNNDDKRLREMESDPMAVERLAREKYLMHRENEDIFVVLDEERPEAPADTTTAITTEP